MLYPSLDDYQAHISPNFLRIETFLAKTMKERTFSLVATLSLSCHDVAIPYFVLKERL